MTLLICLASAAYCIRLSAQPALIARLLSPQRLEIAWTNTTSDLSLEETTELRDTASWTSVTESIAAESDSFSVLLSPLGRTRFFRLAPLPLVTILDSSPRDEERGVAVTRETIIQLSAPLATNTIVSNDHLFAGFGGRRLLSRVEVSSDRRTVTLFYLEPLPGSARINVVFDGTGLTDLLGRPLDLDGDGQPNGSALIAFETLSLTPLAGTAVIGKVFASELMPGPDTGTNAVNRPLEGVTITMDGREETLRTKTDGQGNFKLEPVPAGRFFVHIDGRTAKGSTWPNGAYYPFVGKAWEAVAGKTNNLAGGTGEIFLPLIKSGTLQPVSATQDTVISFPPEVLQANPALAGVSITIPANSLYNENGTRGGKVGIAPVPPDRLPGPLPPGVQPPVIITVQTDGGLNFDRPAPICFPNLPDPVLGVPLPAGSKQSLIVFNHDKGNWEVAASMHVSEDGKLICTDPGQGVRQPGWDGVAPDPTGPPPPPCGPPPGPSPNPRPTHSSVSGTIAAFGNPPDPCGCHLFHDKCIDSLNNDKLKALNKCNVDYKSHRNPQKLAECNDQASADASNRNDACLLAADSCNEECKKRPPPPPNPPPAPPKPPKPPKKAPKPPAQCRPKKPKPKPQAAPGTIRAQNAAPLVEREVAVQQVIQLLDQITLLTQPYTGSEWPADVLAQYLDLAKRIDDLTGGNPNYIHDYLLDLELAGEANGELEEPDGNAPAYPVKYAAEIIRPDGPFVIRGETEPYGQYTIFVPRDGELRSVHFYDPEDQSFGMVFPWLRSNPEWRLPSFELFPLTGAETDQDRDGLPDLVEFVYGTDPTNPDSDKDGVLDGAEVKNGTNPLDGVPTIIGAIASVDTPGTAVDIWTGNNLAIVADSGQGVAIFDISDAFNPVLVQQLVTPAPVTSVSAEGQWGAFTQGDFGVGIIDLREPAQATIINQSGFETAAERVIVAQNVAYAGLFGGDIVALNLPTGAVLKRLSLGEAIIDITVAEDQLYVLTGSRLLVYDLVGKGFILRGSLAQNVAASTDFHFFVGGGLAYVGGFSGYSVFDVHDFANMRLIATPPPGVPLPPVRDLVANGSGLLAGSATFTGLPLVVSLFDVSSPTIVTNLLTSIDTPGFARALSIYNGLAFVADDIAGLQVVNYLPYDNQTKPPKVTLSANFPLTGGSAEEGSFLRMTANTSDDVQVRNVEFYLDGAQTWLDGGYPFEFRFQTPRILTNKTSFTLRAKVTDTGGNSTWSDEVTVGLTPDRTPPLIFWISPRYASAPTDRLSVRFSEPIGSGADLSGLPLFIPGPDGQLGTADDQLVDGGAVTLSADQLTATRVLPAKLTPGFYRFIVKASIADLRGNQIGADATNDFRVVDAVYWSSPSGGDWNNPANWSTGRVPDPDDDVLIATVLPTYIYHIHPLSQIKSLILGNPMLIRSGKLAVAGPLTIAHQLTLFSGTLEGARLTIDSSIDAADVRVRAGTWDSVTLESDVTLQNGDSLVVLKDLTLNAKLFVAPTNGAAQITFNGSAIKGNGEIIFGTNAVSVMYATFANLTIGPDITIRAGAGHISGGNVVNEGTIMAEEPNKTLIIQSRPFINRGLVEIKNGATLSLMDTWKNEGVIKLNDATFSMGGTFTNSDIGKIERTGGTVKLAGVLVNTGSTLSLNEQTGSWVQESGTIRGGRLITSGGATLSVSGWWDGLTVDTDLNLQNGNSVVVQNDLILNAKLTFPPGNAAAQIVVSGGTLRGSGQIIFGDTTSSQISGNFTIGPMMTVRGGVGTISIGGGAITNEGTILADGAKAALNLQASPFVNRGVVGLDNGATISLFPGGWRNQGVVRLHEGTLKIGASLSTPDIGRFERTGGTVKLSGLLNNEDATFMLDAQTGSWVQEAGTIKGGTLATRDGATLELKSGVWDGLTLANDFTIPNAVGIAAINGLTVNGKLTFASVGSVAGLVMTGRTLGGNGQVIFGSTGRNILQSSAPLTIESPLTIRGGLGEIDTGSNALTNNTAIISDGSGSTITIRARPFINNGTTQELNGGRITIAP